MSATGRKRVERRGQKAEQSIGNTSNGIVESKGTWGKRKLMWPNTRGANYLHQGAHAAGQLNQDITKSLVQRLFSDGLIRTGKVYHENKRMGEGKTGFEERKVRSQPPGSSTRKRKVFLITKRVRPEKKTTLKERKKGTS